MRSIGLCLSLSLTALLCQACSTEDNSSDAGMDSGFADAADADADAEADTDQPTEDAGPKPDYDPGASILAFVPEGGAYCSTFFESRSWQQELAMVAQIVLRPGFYILPRQTGEYQEDLVERVLFGPNRTLAQPVSTGQMKAAFTDFGAGGEFWNYTYRQEYLWGQNPMQVEITVSFYSEDGKWPTEVILPGPDHWAMTHARILIGPGEDMISEIQTLGSCKLPPGGRRLIQASTGDGTQLVLDVRFSSACMMSGNTTCYTLYSAELSHQAVISDPFQLIYSAIHHNFAEKYLILLEPPADDVHALLVEAPDFGEEQGNLMYLDANRQELRSQAIVEWTEGS